MERLGPDRELTVEKVGPQPLFLPISGTYKNKWPAADKVVLELRVDVDGRRPQQRISGDVFRQQFVFSAEGPTAGLLGEPIPIGITYQHSFVVDTFEESYEGGSTVLTGAIRYYNDPTIVDEAIEVRIKRVLLKSQGLTTVTDLFFRRGADAIVSFYKAGNLVQTYVCPKISSYFRNVTLEIDHLQGTVFPPEVDTDIDPYPAGLPVQKMSTRKAFLRAGIDMKVVTDDVLNDADADIDEDDDGWSMGELHDLMEAHFDKYADRLQWNVYGVVVPRLQAPRYGYYGVMFDFGKWQTDDIYLRQGVAVAQDAIRSALGPLYDDADENDRLFLQTFIHEVGHAFNLPHTWGRTGSPDTASESFMNYPWKFTGGTGGAAEFWANFWWEFDDVELLWMRHQDRIDVIFGGTDWISDNLSGYLQPQVEIRKRPLALSLKAPRVLDFAEPVRLEVTLTNVSDTSQHVIDRLEPEDGFLTLFMRRPNGDFVRYVPPVSRISAPGDVVTLAPGESIEASVLVSFGAHGLQFAEPGEYRIRAYYGHPGQLAAISPVLRLRVAAPAGRHDEELAYLLFDRNVATFLYFDGSERHPEVISELKEAAKKYEKTNPRVVRHVQAALGMHASRSFKHVVTKRNKRVVVIRKPELEEAIADLTDATTTVPGSKLPAMDDVRYATLTGHLAASQDAHGDEADAEKTLDRGVKFLKKKKADPSVVDGLEALKETLTEH